MTQRGARTDPMAVPPSAPYSVDFWTKTDVGATTQAVVEFYDSGDVLIATHTIPADTGTGDWQETSYSNTSPALTAYAVLDVGTADAPAVTLYLDDVSLATEGPVIDSGAVEYQPAVYPVQAIVMPTISSGAQTFAPSLAYVVAMPTIASGAVLYAPTVTPGAVDVALPTIASGAVLFAPTVAGGVVMPTIPSGAQLFAPTVAPGAVNVSLPTIASGAVLNPPSLTEDVILPFIASGAQTFAPSVTPGAVAVSMPAIASGAVLFAPTVAHVVTQAIVMPFITSADALYAPSVAPVVPPPIVVGGSGGYKRHEFEPYEHPFQPLIPQPKPLRQYVAVPAIASTAMLYPPGVAIDWLSVARAQDEELVLMGVL